MQKRADDDELDKARACCTKIVETVQLCARQREVDALSSLCLVTNGKDLQRHMQRWQISPPKGVTRSDLLEVVGSIAGDLRQCFQTHHALLHSSGIELLDGRYTHAMLAMNVRCRTDVLFLSALQPSRLRAALATCADHFVVAKRAGLAIDRTKPILTYTVHELMRALYAVYTHTGQGEYHEQLFTYTETLLTRMRALLVTTASCAVFDVVALRQRDEDRRHGVFFRASREFVALGHILDYWLTRWFNSPMLAGEVVAAPDRREISKDRLRLVRKWLQRHASKYVDQDTQMSTVAGLMRAGEMALYADLLPGAVVSEPDVMSYYRTEQFLSSTERALWPVSRVFEDSLATSIAFESSQDGHPWSQKESPQLCSAAISVLTAQLRMASGHVKPEEVIVANDEKLRECALRLTPKQTPWPVLVVCCNRMQVWHKGRLLMYNSVIDSLCVWFALVEGECKNKLGDALVERLIDDVFHSEESNRERLERHNPQLKRQLGVESERPAASIHRPLRFEDD